MLAEEQLVQYVCWFLTGLQVRKPRAGRLQVKPVCTTSDNRGVCYSHSPDFLGAAQGDNNYCGAALINSSHIATYRQCDTLSFSGGNCVTYPGERRVWELELARSSCSRECMIKDDVGMEMDLSALATDRSGAVL